MPHFHFLWEKGYLPKQESQLEEPVVDLSPLKVKDLPMMNSCDPQGYYQFITEMVNEIKTSDGIIFNTSEDLEEQALTTIRQEFHIPIFPIGPFHKWFPTSYSNSLLSEDESCISWLNSQAPKSVVYVSFGSIAAINEAQFLEIAWGLANTNQPFLWVVRPGLIQGSEWLEKLPQGYLEALNEKGHTVKWAPQKKVLAHPAVGLFWTHNGWNSTLESISEGVPMVCMPNSTDQTVNARYVSDVWRVGLQLENGIERGEIEKIIRKMIAEKEGEEIKDNMSKLKEKTNFSLREGGSSYQSLDGLVNHILSL
ncbi:hypothetical protein ABKV19_024112 [Rosa sericea]